MGLTGVGRRVRRRGLVLAAVAVSVLVATAVLAAVAGLARAAATDGVRERLAADPGRSVELDARWAADGLPAADRAVHVALVRALAGTPFRTETALRAAGTLDLPLPAAARSRASDTVLPGLPLAVPDPSRLGRLRSGDWPTAGASGNTLPVALPEAAADRLGLTAGGQVDVRDPASGGTLTLRVTGVYRPDPAAAAVWAGLGGDDRAAPALLLVDGHRLTALPAFARRTLAVWLALPDTDRLSLPQLARLRDRVAAFAAGDPARSVYRGSAPALTDTAVHSALPGAVDAQVLPALTARAEVDVPLALLAVLAAVVLVLTARRLAEAAAAEQALQVSRGAGGLRVLGAAVGEWALAAVPAAAAGLLLAGPLLGAVLRSAGASPPAGAAAPAAAGLWWAAGFALLVHGAALLLPLARQALDPGAERALRRRLPLRPGLQRAGADLALLAVAVLGYLQLRHYRSVVADSASSGFATTVDPVLVLAPVAMAVAGAVLLLRVLPPLGRLLERAARRSRGLVLPLGGWRLSRDGGRQAVPVLVTLLAVACAALAAGVLGALPTSDRDRAAFAVGADLRLTGVAGPSAQRHAAVAALPAVGAATPVAERSGYVGNTVVQTVAFNTASDTRIPSLRSDLTDRPVGGELAGQPAEGLAVPGEPTALDLTVRAGADQALPDGGAQLVLSLQDADGLTDQVVAALPADGAEHRVTVDLTAAGPRHYPLRISRLGLRFPVGTAQRTTLELHLTRIEAVAGAGRTALALPPGLSWFRSGTVFSTPEALGCPGTGADPARLPFTDKPQDDKAGACSWSSGGADLLTAVARSQLPGSPWADGGTELDFAVLPGSGTTTAQTPVLSGLADRALLAGLHAKVGDTLSLDWEHGQSGTQLVRIAGVLDAVPGYDPDQGHLVLDLRALAAAGAAAGTPPPTDTHWWLRSADPAAPLAAPDPARFGTAQSARQVAAALAHDPFRTGLRCAWLLVLVTAPLFAVTALTLHAVGAVRARQREFAVLRALGVRRAELTSLLRTEQLAVTVLPSLLGGVLGLVLAAVLLPLTVLDDGSGPVFPTLLTAPGRPPAVLAALVGGALLSAAVLVLTRVLGRVDLVRALRAGEDG
ncbi:FtsX-like permease family protein [Kitasatospora sp. NPDC058965]|uniref:FtsX-like permease family protein n=1 Tax=Kitasatospora sp. NPDC058965 TaxID=3346682 RepID=UPI0036A73777